MITKDKLNNPNVEVTPLALPLDFFGRIFIGYGIYQFIVAFRRHSRKAM
jgi:hypothetical protein